MSRRSRGGGAPISLFAFQDLITSLSGILIFLVLLLALDVALQVNTIHRDEDDAHGDPVLLDSLREAVEILSAESDALRRSLEAIEIDDAVGIAREVTVAQREWSAHTERLRQLEARISALEDELRSEGRKADELVRKLAPLEKDLRRLRAAMARAVKENKVFFIPERGTTKTPILVECSSNSVRVGFIDRATSPVQFSHAPSGLARFEKNLTKYSTAREYFVLMIKPSAAGYWRSFHKKIVKHGFDVGYDALEEDKSIGFGKVQP